MQVRSIVTKALTGFLLAFLFSLSFAWKAYILELPEDYDVGFGLGVSGEYLCGWGKKNSIIPQAVLFDSGRQAFLYDDFQFHDIHPADSYESYALGVSNGFVVGKSRPAYDNRNFHAVVWYDPPSRSVLDIHAWGDSSEAVDSSGFYILMNVYGHEYSQPLLYDWVFQQVYKPLSSFPYSKGNALERNPITGEYIVGGVVFQGSAKLPVAFAWISKGTQKIEIDMNPHGAIESVINDVSMAGGETACGYSVYPSDRQPKATIWNGMSREDAVIVSPKGAIVSTANGIHGTIAVGTYWKDPLTPRAFVTILNPNNDYVDLNDVAKSVKSMATKVWQDPMTGKILISGFVYKNGKTSPVIWTNES